MTCDENAESITWIAYFDTNGFETFINLTDAYYKEAMDALINEDYKSELGSMLLNMKLRAQFNGQRTPQIWSFNTTDGFSEETLWAAAEENPQWLADWIREHGKCIYGSDAPTKRNKVISL